MPRQVWVQCLCIADKVIALLILKPLHIYLLCTRGVVVAGVNSSATCRMWCIYTFGVCFVPGITFKYPRETLMLRFSTGTPGSLAVQFVCHKV